MLIDVSRLSVLRQCDLIGLPRSSLYYRAQGEDAWNQQLMRLIDRQYHGHAVLRSASDDGDAQSIGPQGERQAGSSSDAGDGPEPIYPKPRTSLKNQAHLVYPYLLKRSGRSVRIRCGRRTSPCSAATRLGVRGGDDEWFSRYVLAWEMSITLDSSFCVDAARAPSTWAAGDIQQRPGLPVHQRRVQGVLAPAGSAWTV